LSVQGEKKLPFFFFNVLGQLVVSRPMEARREAPVFHPAIENVTIPDIESVRFQRLPGVIAQIESETALIPLVMSIRQGGMSCWVMISLPLPPVHH